MSGPNVSTNRELNRDYIHRQLYKRVGEPCGFQFKDRKTGRMWDMTKEKS